MSKLLLINPGNRSQVFQKLGLSAAAIEPPFWIAVMAAYFRDQGYEVSVIDANAKNLSPEETAKKAKAFQALLTAVIVYGSQPSASTQNMPSAGKICSALKEAGIANVLLAGLHPSALPEKTLAEENCDFVAEGEGILTIEALLESLEKKNSNDFSSIGGLWWRKNAEIKSNERYPVIENLDRYLPQAAWDLLPMQLYRAHNWHCFDNVNERQPYAAIYTSLGCPFSCDFCCINAPFGKPGIRYRSPELVLKEIDYLYKNYKVKNLKIVDELFILNKNHYMPIIEGLIERDYNLNIWVYARVDTIDFNLLPKLKKAGINWIALGIESGSEKIRNTVHKNLHKGDIFEIVEKIQKAGIYVIGNFIFGLPDDTFETMQQTLNLAKNLNCEFVNFYSVMAYPGSKLYSNAIKNTPQILPKTWNGYSQHSYECTPLANDFLSAAEILRFRDKAFQDFFSDENYLSKTEERFGSDVRKHLEEINALSLPRQLYS